MLQVTAPVVRYATGSTHAAMANDQLVIIATAPDGFNFMVDSGKHFFAALQQPDGQWVLKEDDVVVAELPQPVPGRFTIRCGDSLVTPGPDQPDPAVFEDLEDAAIAAAALVATGAFNTQPA